MKTPNFIEPETAAGLVKSQREHHLTQSMSDKIKCDSENSNLTTHEDKMGNTGILTEGSRL